MKVYVVQDGEKRIRCVTFCPDLASKITEIFPHELLCFEQFETIDELKETKP